MGRIRALGLVVLLAAFGAPLPGAHAGDLTAEEVAWVRDLVQALGGNSPRVRQGAESALVAVGIDALPVLVEAWAQVKSEATRKAIRRALDGMGREAVIQGLERMREGRPKAETKRIDDLLADYGGSVAPGAPAAVPLLPETLESPALVPLGAEAPIQGRLPLVAGSHRATEVPGGLSVDADGDGREEATVASGASAMLLVGPSGAGRPVLVYAKRGVWYASSAALLRARQGKVAVEFLDADLDGAFDGPRDFLRVGDGAFGPWHASRRLPVDDGILTYEVRREGASLSLSLTRVPPPAGADPLAWAGLLALHRYRATIGLAPAALDLKRSEACRQHARYLSLNAGSKEVAGLAAHQQVAGRPGASPEGAAAAGSSVVSSHGDPARAVLSFAATMLHRTDLLGDPEGGFGIGAIAGGKSGATVLWGEDWAARGSPAPFVVPAPGQRRVPVRGGPEEPPPDEPPDWYAAARGFPVSVHFTGLGLSSVRIRLYAGSGETPVPGRSWSPEAPIRPGYGRDAAFFMPSAPLEPRQAYTAEATGVLGGRPVRWVWSFRTD